MVIINNESAQILSVSWDKQAMAARNITFKEILDEKATLGE